MYTFWNAKLEKQFSLSYKADYAQTLGTNTHAGEMHVQAQKAWRQVFVAACYITVINYSPKSSTGRMHKLWCLHTTEDYMTENNEV